MSGTWTAKCKLRQTIEIMIRLFLQRGPNRGKVRDNEDWKCPGSQKRDSQIELTPPLYSSRFHHIARWLPVGTPKSLLIFSLQSWNPGSAASAPILAASHGIGRNVICARRRTNFFQCTRAGRLDSTQTTKNRHRIDRKQQFQFSIPHWHANLLELSSILARHGSL